MICFDPKNIAKTILRNQRIKLAPTGTEVLVCSKCGKEFTTRGIVDYMFLYMKNGVPVYAPRPDVLCYECEENKKREDAKDNLIGGPLNNVEV